MKTAIFLTFLLLGMLLSAASYLVGGVFLMVAGLLLAAVICGSLLAIALQTPKGASRRKTTRRKIAVPA